MTIFSAAGLIYFPYYYAGSKKSEKSTPKASPKAEKEFPTVQSPRTLMDSLQASEHSPRESPFSSPRSQRLVKSVKSEHTQKSDLANSHSAVMNGPRNDRLTDEMGDNQGRLTPTDYLVEEIMGESAVLPSCPSGTVKPVLNGHSKRDKTMVLKTNGSLMKVGNIAECSPRGSILQYF